ncbi:recombinase family protein [Sporosarcina sp. SG10008]|uniref:recombinase family protein n=1 Tax=Sporosarcina sp. SG10008 TaxID=3373103 RepID=UPI0037DDB234
MSWEIVDVYKDADSGTKLDKDGLEAMLDAIEEGLVDIVLCIEQDRLSRLDTVKWEYLKSVLRDNDVKIAEPGSIVDLTNIDDEFVSDIKNLVAQRSRKDMLRKMVHGTKQRTREGKV